MAQRQTGFPPLASNDSKVLILGSMPGMRSLREFQYYAHTQNSFWKIMAEILGFDCQIDYQSRVNCLLASGIAVWDVIDSCIRPGSLDSSIDNASVTLNNFSDFFASHTQLRAVFCNGGKAFHEFSKHVMPKLEDFDLPHHQLLSTSPANARYSFSEKLNDWQQISRFL